MGCGAALKIGIRSARHPRIAIDSDGTYPASAVPQLRREVGGRYFAYGEGRVRRSPLQVARPEI